MTAPLSWVVGAGGLLGSHVTRTLAQEGVVWTPELAVPWDQPEGADLLGRAARAFLKAADGGPWQVAWCAGAGVTGTDRASLAAEVVLFEQLLTTLARSGAGREGALFFASSAGGVYAGAAEAPFTETHPVAPLSPYGEAKVALEGAATSWGEQTGVPVLLGRIANLYGPGQNLAKPQGLISQLCRAQLLRQPVSMFVPLDTVRDYLFAPDCAELIARSLGRLRAEGGVHVKVLASQQAVTIGALVGELRRVFKSAPRIVYGSSSTSHFHARDLRLRSQVWTDLDRRPVTPLPVGIKATLLGLGRMLGEGRLA